MQKVIVIVGWCVRLCLFSGSLKSNGVILNDLVQRLGSTNSMVGWAFALQQGVSYFSCPIASLLLRVFTKRQLAVTGGFLVGISYICCGLFVENLGQLFFVYVLSGIGFGFNILAGYFSFVEHFYDDLVTMVPVTSLFSFVGLAILPLVLQYFKTSFGLRQGLALFGGLLLNMVVSAVAVTLPDQNKRIEKTSMTQPDEKQSCPYSDRETEDKTKGKVGKREILKRYFRSWSEIFCHENAAIFLGLEGLMYYIFVSWGLFLVSVGTAAGLSPEQAVLLSTSGGIGGFLGKVMAIGLFHIKKMNAYTSSMIPLFCNAISLLGCSLVTDFYIMLIFTFITGACLGLNSSGLSGLLPSIVCKYHYQKTYLIVSIVNGITTQLGGLVSGFISDVMGSASYVFVFNAILSISGLPFVCLWACRGPSEKCNDP